MHERGQKIGLHFALNGMTDMQDVRKQIVKEMHMLSEMLGFEISEFSVHRPSPAVLAENIKLPGIILRKPHRIPVCRRAGMCGICGFVSRRDIRLTQLKKMNDTMYHRGPDDSGEEIYEAADGYSVGRPGERMGKNLRLVIP